MAWSNQIQQLAIRFILILVLAKNGTKMQSKRKRRERHWVQNGAGDRRVLPRRIPMRAILETFQALVHRLPLLLSIRQFVQRPGDRLVAATAVRLAHLLRFQLRLYKADLSRGNYLAGYSDTRSTISSSGVAFRHSVKWILILRSKLLVFSNI